ncbi:MAG: branched-chain amino acid transaminase, partial [Dehalococcoidia bacterium]|nr:branched-chain amino acid transaminase [Dehalococcoidia bacterium]
EFQPVADCKISIMTHALHYGTACFEGIRVNWNDVESDLYLFRLREHQARLLKSCKVLKINLPYTVQELCDLAVELAQRSGYKEDVYIRPLAYKSSETIGPKLHALEDGFFMTVTPFPPYLDVEKGVRACVSSWRRIDDTMFPPRAKVTGLYINSAIAKTDAVDAGYDEAILLTADGHISEGTGQNLMMILDGKLVTPPSSDNVLLGITKDTMMTLARDELGVETEERTLDRSELYMADEAFFTGTASHLTPILEVDSRPVGNGQIGEITRKLMTLYFDIIRGKNARYREQWCTPVYRRS